MATTNIPNAEQEKLQHEWLSGLRALVEEVEKWAQELGWSTRQIEKRMEDSEVGTYQAPALLMQHETTRLFLEPVARSVPFAEGRADLYLMPFYNDIAQLYFSNGAWELLYLAPYDWHSRIDYQPLTTETLQKILQEMRMHAA